MVMGTESWPSLSLMGLEFGIHAVGSLSLCPLGSSRAPSAGGNSGLAMHRIGPKLLILHGCGWFLCRTIASLPPCALWRSTMSDVFIWVFPKMSEGGSVCFVLVVEHWELAITVPANVEFGPKSPIFRVLGDFTVLILGRF